MLTHDTCRSCACFQVNSCVQKDFRPKSEIERLDFADSHVLKAASGAKGGDSLPYHSKPDHHCRSQKSQPIPGQRNSLPYAMESLFPAWCLSHRFSSSLGALSFLTSQSKKDHQVPVAEKDHQWKHIRGKRSMNGVQ